MTHRIDSHTFSKLCKYLEPQELATCVARTALDKYSEELNIALSTYNLALSRAKCIPLACRREVLHELRVNIIDAHRNLNTIRDLIHYKEDHEYTRTFSLR